MVEPIIAVDSVLRSQILEMVREVCGFGLLILLVWWYNSNSDEEKSNSNLVDDPSWYSYEVRVIDNVTIWIFDCGVCGKEVRRAPGLFYTPTGYCDDCNGIGEDI